METESLEMVQVTEREEAQWVPNAAITHIERNESGVLLRLEFMQGQDAGSKGFESSVSATTEGLLLEVEIDSEFAEVIEAHLSTNLDIDIDSDYQLKVNCVVSQGRAGRA
ncbi:MAG TPA: hypothetical protein VM008_06710 [Phycisphaerae bacterium]|nr:hypothetical protein [Phycisphaerae bacterium]